MVEVIGRLTLSLVIARCVVVVVFVSRAYAVVHSVECSSDFFFAVPF